MAEKAQFTGVNEHFEAIFNKVSALFGSYDTASSVGLSFRPRVIKGVQGKTIFVDSTNNRVIIQRTFKTYRIVHLWY